MRGAGLILSVGLHAGAAALAVIGWPYLSPDEPLIIPDVPIELISEAEIADEVSIPEQSREEEPEPAPEQAPEPQEPEPAPEPPAPEPEPEPAAPPPPEEADEPEPEPEPEPEAPKPDSAPEPEPDPEPEDDLAGLDDVLRDLDPDKQERKAPSETPEAPGGTVDTDRVGTGRTLTLTEDVILKQAFARCWQEPGAVPNRERLVVTVRVRLNRNGTLAGTPSVLNDGEINRSGNRFWQAARINAVAAVTGCAPYDFLPDALIEDAIKEGGFDYTFRPEAY